MEPYGESGGPRLVEPLLEHEILEASSMGQLLVAITTQGAAFEALTRVEFDRQDEGRWCQSEEFMFWV